MSGLIINPFIEFPSGGGGGGALPTIVQHKEQYGQSLDPTITLGSAPTSGNRIFACYLVDGSISNLNTAGWTLIAKDDVTAPHAVWLYRDVLPGDSATLPVFESPHQTSTACAAIAYEVAGSNAVLASAVDQTHFDRVTTGSPTVTSSVNTGAANCLGLLAYGGLWFFGTAPTIAGPWTQDESHANFSKADGSAHQSFVTAGSPVSGTITTGTGYTYYAFALILLKG